MIIDFIILILNHKDLELLKRNVVGEGGWQSILREIQSQITTENQTTILRMTGPQLVRVANYLTKYGEPGGWQQRLDILKKIAFVALKAIEDEQANKSLDEFK
jgi:hypothetical protein